MICVPGIPLIMDAKNEGLTDPAYCWASQLATTMCIWDNTAHAQTMGEDRCAST